MAGLPTVDDASFGDAVEKAEELVVVDFTAAWCPPCRLIGPILERLAAEYGSRTKIVALDVDQNPATAGRFGVRSLPTLVFFRDGAEVDRLVGAYPPDVLRARIDGKLVGAGSEGGRE